VCGENTTACLNKPGHKHCYRLSLGEEQESVRRREEGRSAPYTFLYCFCGGRRGVSDCPLKECGKSLSPRQRKHRESAFRKPATDRAETLNLFKNRFNEMTHVNI